LSHFLLGVMAIYMNNRRFEELSFFRKLALKGTKLGITVMVFSPEDVHHDRKKIYGLFYHQKNKKWFRRWTRFPDIVYDRCRNQATERFKQLRQFRGKYPHLTFLNRPLSNKWNMYLILSKNPDIQPHLPYTVKFAGFKQMKQLLNQKGLLFLKPSNGTGGRGIIRLRRAPGGRIDIQGRDQRRRIISRQILTVGQFAAKIKSWPLKEKYMLQQGINLTLPDGRVHDYRLLIQKDDRGQWAVTGYAGRIGPKSSVTSNLHGGGTAVPVDRLLRRTIASSEKNEAIKKKMEKLAHDIAKYLEKEFGTLCELGLDIAVDSGGKVWLLEINPKPSREIFRLIGESTTYDRAITRPLQYAAWVYQQKQKPEPKPSDEKAP